MFVASKYGQNKVIGLDVNRAKSLQNCIFKKAHCWGLGCISNRRGPQIDKTVIKIVRDIFSKQI